MIGCVVAGQFVNTNPQIAGPNKLLFEVKTPKAFRHICLFLLGTQPVPQDRVALIYVTCEKLGIQDWKYIGYITNDKPSSIFRLSSGGEDGGGGDADMGDGGEEFTAKIGISIDTEQQLQIEQENKAKASFSSSSSTLTPSSSSSSSSSSPSTTLTPQSTDPQATILYIRNICKHLYNFLMSFAKGNAIPVSSMDKWLESVNRKLNFDPNYFTTVNPTD